MFDRVIYFLWYTFVSYRINNEASTFKLPAPVFLSSPRVSKFPFQQNIVHRVLIYTREIDIQKDLKSTLLFIKI